MFVTLLYNYFSAKQSGGKFLVRLEDTDRDRYTPEFLDYFKNMCDWLGIVPDRFSIGIQIHHLVHLFNQKETTLVKLIFYLIKV
jgi:glutamyl/glutaminyl-tRNA synthetase